MPNLSQPLKANLERAALLVSEMDVSSQSGPFLLQAIAYMPVYPEYETLPGQESSFHHCLLESDFAGREEQSIFL